MRKQVLATLAAGMMLGIAGPASASPFAPPLPGDRGRRGGRERGLRHIGCRLCSCRGFQQQRVC